MKAGIKISLTVEDAESVECYLRGAIETATDMPELEWERLEMVCDRIWRLLAKAKKGPHAQR